MKKENSYKMLRDMWGFKKGEVVPDEYGVFGTRPDLFAPYKFTTHDEVDIYGNQITIAINQSNSVVLFEGMDYDGVRKDWKYFSSIKAAQQYLDEQGKPKFDDTVISTVDPILPQPTITIDPEQLDAILSRVKEALEKEFFGGC